MTIYKIKNTFITRKFRLCFQIIKLSIIICNRLASLHMLFKLKWNTLFIVCRFELTNQCSFDAISLNFEVMKTTFLSTTKLYHWKKLLTLCSQFKERSGSWSPWNSVTSSFCIYLQFDKIRSRLRLGLRSYTN